MNQEVQEFLRKIFIVAQAIQFGGVCKAEELRPFFSYKVSAQTDILLISVSMTKEQGVEKMQLLFNAVDMQGVNVYGQNFTKHEFSFVGDKWIDQLLMSKILEGIVSQIDYGSYQTV